MNSNVKLFTGVESSTKFWLAILAICLQLEKPLSLQGVVLQHTSGIVPPFLFSKLCSNKKLVAPYE